MILDLFEELNKISGNFKNWILENNTNPVLWIGLFLLGLAIFGMTYRILNKHK